jgi:hypothetical protein
VVPGKRKNHREKSRAVSRKFDPNEIFRDQGGSSSRRGIEKEIFIENDIKTIHTCQ